MHIYENHIVECVLYGFTYHICFDTSTITLLLCISVNRFVNNQTNTIACTHISLLLLLMTMMMIKNRIHVERERNIHIQLRLLLGQSSHRVLLWWIEICTNSCHTVREFVHRTKNLPNHFFFQQQNLTTRFRLPNTNLIKIQTKIDFLTEDLIQRFIVCGKITKQTREKNSVMNK